MKRLLLFASAVGFAACFNFDAAYQTYCTNARCDGGTGGSSGGGSTAGGSTGGGSIAGGAGGGTSAGGSSGGGSAGGSVDSGVDSGTPDAGVPPCNQDFCLWGNTQRLASGDKYIYGRGVMANALQTGAAIFKKRDTTNGAYVITHNAGPGTTPGTVGQQLGTTPAYGDLGGGEGTANSFYYFTNYSLITAQIEHVTNGGPPGVAYDGQCGSTAMEGRSFTIVGDGGFLLVGGEDEAICEVDVNASSARPIQLANGSGGNVDVTDIYRSPTDEIFFTAEDGYIYQVDAGRVSTQLDTGGYGTIAIDGTSSDNVWAIGKGGIVAWRNPDGGGNFEIFTDLGTTTYDLKVTNNGVYVGAFGGIYYLSQTTDGGFQKFNLPTVGSVSRPWHLNAGDGYLHVVGDYGANGTNNTPTGSFFMTFQTRTR